MSVGMKRCEFLVLRRWRSAEVDGLQRQRLLFSGDYFVLRVFLIDTRRSPEGDAF